MTHRLLCENIKSYPLNLYVHAANHSNHASVNKWSPRIADFPYNYMLTCLRPSTRVAHISAGPEQHDEFVGGNLPKLACGVEHNVRHRWLSQAIVMQGCRPHTTNTPHFDYCSLHVYRE